LKEYWLATVDAFASKWPDPFRARLVALRDAGATIAFWRSSSAGLPSNGGGKIEPAAPGVIHTSPGPLNLRNAGTLHATLLPLRNAGTLHATLLPPKWTGDRWWIVALTGEVIGDEEKYGALTREILGEAV
jgi:hypothetical protein